MHTIHPVCRDLNIRGIHETRLILFLKKDTQGIQARQEVLWQKIAFLWQMTYIQWYMSCLCMTEALEKVLRAVSFPVLRKTAFLTVFFSFVLEKMTKYSLVYLC